jgi:hypothetical protein
LQVPRTIESLSDVTVSIPEAVLSQELEGEVVLLDTAGGEYYGLDPVGSRIWTLLRQHKGRPDAVVDALTVEYEVPRERLINDLRGFLIMLEHFGLVALHPAEDAVS